MKKRRKNRKASESKSLMKQKAWKEFSIYIRQRGSVGGLAKCVSCGDFKPWREQQAGHFVPGRGNSVLFDERNTHVQCYVCNVRRHGNLLPYYDFMEEKYGKEIIAELRILAMQPKQMRHSDYEEIYTKYKQLNQGDNHAT